MTNEPTQEPKPRTYLRNDPDVIAQLLSQNRVWANGELITDLKLDHAENVIHWMDGQASYILRVLGQHADAISEATQLHWLHGTALMKALDAHVFHLKRVQEIQPPPGLTPTGWLLKPLAALDIETTGVDLENDRIVSFSIGVAEEPGEWQSITQIVDPGVEIPEGASNVHGITTERAREEGIPEKAAILSLAKSLKSLSERNVPIIGHNVRFDLTILDRASRRITGEGLVIGPVLDTMVIDKAIDQFRRGKRTLDATCKHYGVEDGEAHVADNDAKRALRLLWHELTSAKAREFFEELPDLPAMTDLLKNAYAAQAAEMKSWRRYSGQEDDIKDLAWPIATLPGGIIKT